MKIFLNMIGCRICHDHIISNSTHNYVTCKCGAVSVDGGQDYLKRTGNREDWVERSVFNIDRNDLNSDYLDGMWVIFSPQGKDPPKMAFHHRQDAEEIAKHLKTKHPEQTFFVSQAHKVS
jgi:hypothetical protein